MRQITCIEENTDRTSKEKDWSLTFLFQDFKISRFTLKSPKKDL